MASRALLKVVPDLRIVDSQPYRRTLNSWKEIAQYMRMGVRTVQRYETKLGMPVHRIGLGTSSSVFAFCDEIDLWLTMSPTRNNLKAAHACAIFSSLLEALRAHAGNCLDCCAALKDGKNPHSIAS